MTDNTRRNGRRVYDELARIIVPGDRQPIKMTTSTPGEGDVETDQDGAWINPMTAVGSMIEGGESGAPVEVLIGTNGQVLTATDVGGGVIRPRWATGGGGGYTDEQAQDAVGGILVPTSSVVPTYTDATPEITFAVVEEWVRDLVESFLVAGTGITLTPDDPGDTLEIAASGGGGAIVVQEEDSTIVAAATTLDFAGAGFNVTDEGSGEARIENAITQYTDEQARDAVGAALVAGNNIDITVDDGLDTITVAVEALTSADVTDFDEAAQDTIGAISIDTDSIDVTYTDATPELKWDVKTAWLTSFINALIADLEGGESASPGNWLFTHRYASFQAQPGSATKLNYGFGSNTPNGSTSNADDTDGNWVQHSINLINNQAGERSNNTWRPDWGLTYICRFKTGPDITSVRYWIAMSSSSPITTATPTAHIAGFRFDTSVPDTNWQCVTSDNSGTLTITDSGVAAAADTALNMRIIFGTSVANFFINGNLVASHEVANGDKLPVAASLLGTYTSLTTLVAAARVIKFGQVAVGTLN